MSLHLVIEKGVPLPSLRQPRPEGACNNCPRIPRPGYKTCDHCLAQVKKAYRQRRAQGLCGYGTTCPNQAMPGHSMCEAHLRSNTQKIRTMLTDRVKRGLCRLCGEKPLADAAHCFICRIKARTARTRRGMNISDNPLPQKTRKLIRWFWKMDRIAERRALADSILPLLKDDRERQIFTLRHGLNDGIDAPLEAISLVLGLTRERIRQIEERALNRLEDNGHQIAILKYPFDSLRPISSAPRKNKLPTEEKNKRENARREARQAIQAGHITRKPCETCGEPNSQGHHTDYDKPLDLQWLCRKHHMKAHGKGDRKSKRADRGRPRKRRNWIAGLGPYSTERYAVGFIRQSLLKTNPKLKTLCREIGISPAVLKMVLHGERVTGRILSKVFAYIEAAKQDAIRP